VKILYVSQYFPPEMGAPAARAAELAQHWSQAGHDVSVLTGFPNHPTGVVPPQWRALLRRLTYQEKAYGVDVFRTWLWPLPNRKSHERMRNYASYCLSAALRGLTLPCPDVIIATSPQLLVGLAGWWIAFAREIPLDFEVRDLWPESLTAVGVGSEDSLLHHSLAAVARFLYKRADHIVVVTPAFKDRLIETAGFGQRLTTNDQRRTTNGPFTIPFTPPMHTLHVVGARPNFMKAAPILRALGAYSDIRQTLVHTGQHYDSAMSDVFFQQLGMPEPDCNLAVSSGTHAQQTAAVMQAFEPILQDRKPDLVLVYGDVNSTVAAALVCSKLGVRIAHVEAGLRSRDRTMAEEINRLLTDQLSDLLFTPSSDGDENLIREGIEPSRIHRVGNVMIDSLVRLLPTAEKYFPGGVSSPYALVTLHRPSNVDDLPWLGELLTALSELSTQMNIVFPVHPRTRQRLKEVENVTAHGMNEVENATASVETGASPVPRSEASGKSTDLDFVSGETQSADSRLRLLDPLPSPTSNSSPSNAVPQSSSPTPVESRRKRLSSASLA
jgi:hypothetical protein